MNPLAAAPSVVEALVAERVGRLPMNEPAFLEFYARTSGPVSRYLRRLTRDAGVADDLLQDAYLRLLTAANVPADDEQQFSELIETLQAGSEGASSRPVRVFTISYGEEADVVTLRAVAQATRAATYNASNPATIEQVFTAVISNF